MDSQELIEGFKGFEQFSTIICIDNADITDLTINAEYKVYNDNKYHNMKGVGVEIFNDSNNTCFYHPNRFIDKKAYRNNKIQQIIND